MTENAGFLNDLGLENVETAPADGKYAAYLYDCKFVEYKDTSKGKALVFTYRIADGKFKGEDIQEWKSANAFDDNTKKKWLKARVLSLGVPESRIGAVNPQDLVGLAVWITIKKNGEYTNVNKVELRDEAGNATAAPLEAPQQAAAPAVNVTADL